MSDRTYPYSAWLLTRNFHPMEVELVGPGYADSTCDRTQSGRNYQTNELFQTKAEAIACGERKLAVQVGELAKRKACLLKRKRELQQHK